MSDQTTEPTSGTTSGPTSAQIREWAVAQGMTVPAKGRLPEEARRAYEMAHGDSPATIPGQIDALDMLDGPAVAETPPRAPEQGMAARARAKLGTAAAGATSGRRRARVSLEGLIGGAWALLAHLAGQTGQVPVQRALIMQAPVAGALADSMLRDTLADRILQPLARLGDRSETILALVGPPVLVGLIDNAPALAPQLMPMLERSLESWAVIAGPQIRKAEARRKKAVEELGADGIDDLISEIFAPVDEADSRGGNGGA